MKEQLEQMKQKKPSPSKKSVQEVSKTKLRELDDTLMSINKKEYENLKKDHKLLRE